MGRVDSNPDNQGQGKSKRKSKGRMSYLKNYRAGKGRAEQKCDEHGQLYGDYEPAYGGGSYKPRWRNNRRQGYNQGGPGGNGNGNGGGRRRPWGEPLKPGMKGFLITTNFREKECVQDAYNLLNEYTEEKEQEQKVTVTVHGDDSVVKKIEMEGVGAGDADIVLSKEDGNKKADDSGVEIVGENDKELEPDMAASTEVCQSEVKGDEAAEVPVPIEEKEADIEPNGEKEEKGRTEKKEDEDIDAALKNEIKDLKNERANWKFSRADTGVNNVVFINSTIDSPTPTELVHKIFEDVFTKKQTKSRHILRFVPIEIVCNCNNMDEIKARVNELIGVLKTGYVSYKIVANSRYNASFLKDDLIQTLAEMIFRANPLSFVDLNNPQYTILIEVLKTNMCIGFVKDFSKFKKFNLLEAGAVPVSPKQPKAKEAKAGVVTASGETGKQGESLPITQVQEENQTDDSKVANEQKIEITKTEVENTAPEASPASPMDQDILGNQDESQPTISQVQEEIQTGDSKVANEQNVEITKTEVENTAPEASPASPMDQDILGNQDESQPTISQVQEEIQTGDSKVDPCM